MKRLYLVFQFLLFVGTISNAQKQSFDSKFIKVGVMSNKWPSCMDNNPNLRKLGTLQGTTIDQNRIGKRVMDILFQRDGNGCHMDRLYEDALQNTTVEELEVALRDASAESKDVLKREIAHQLLKNNYIVIFHTENKGKKRDGTPKTKEYWSVYHVEIDDKIIQQAYLNWQNPSVYDQIQVPVKLIAKGKVPNNILDNDELVYDIAKKVPAFAVRGPVTSRFPFTARMGQDMGMKKVSRVSIYRFVEDKAGNYYSKQICRARTTEVTNDATRMYMISGSFPSTKKGDVAVLKDRHRSSISLMGQGSFGNDARIGGRLQYEYLLDFSKHGIAQYLIGAIGYNRHDKEPIGIWWDESKTIQPTLNNANISIGYGIGFNFLGRMELMPYVMVGYQHTFITGGNDPMYYWDNQKELWPDLYGVNDEAGLYYSSVVGHAGARLCVNIWYPLQLSVGADYNLSTKSSRLEPFLDRHTLNRLNLYAGFRLHF